MVHAVLLALRVRMRAFARNELWPSIRMLQAAFPGLSFSDIPVTGCDFLAYSCAAARDLHPLPISQRVAGLRSCANLILRKSEKQRSGKFTGHPDTKSNVCGRAGASPVQPWAGRGARLSTLD